MRIAATRPLKIKGLWLFSKEYPRSRATFPRKILGKHPGITSNHLLQIEEGSLYPALQRLLKEELVKAEWAISSTNRRVRIYKLTAAGAKHLEHEVSRFEKMLEGITRVLAPGES
jgi:PadR family transcriptional regulator PadR